MQQKKSIWMEGFNQAMVSAGRKLASHSRILEWGIEEESSSVYAEVDDSWDVVELEININRTENGKPLLAGDCSCDAHAFCMHWAAALIHATKYNPDLFAGLETDGKGNLARAEAVLPKDFQSWFVRLRGASQPANPPQGGENAEKPSRIFYLLKLKSTEDGPHLYVSLVQMRRLPKGGFGNPTVVVIPTFLNNKPAYAEASDFALARLIKAHSLGISQFDLQAEVDIADDSLSDLLPRLVKTGRCHWETPLNPALSRGADRQGEPEWKIDGAGLQYAAWNTQPAVSHILPGDPLWYVDTADWSCGVLHTSMANEVARAWLGAPRMHPTEIEQFRDILQPVLERSHLPAPKPVRVEAVADGLLRPCLKFQQSQFQWWEFSNSVRQSSPDGLPVNLARLSFDYDGIRLAPDDERKVIEVFKEGVVCRIKRNFEGEGQVRKRLEDLGFEPAQNSLSGAAAERVKNFWLRRKDDLGDWLRFSQQDLPKIRQDGWIVEYGPGFSFNFAIAEEWYAETVTETDDPWFGFELGVIVDGRRINLLPILIEILQAKTDWAEPSKLAKTPPGALLPVKLEDGRTFPFPAGRLRTIQQALTELYDPKALDDQGRLPLAKLRVAELAALGDAEHWQWRGGDVFKALGGKIRDFQGIKEVLPPPNFKAQLRPYQQQGLSWLQFLAEYELAGILADDMGLGKTVMALAHILLEKQARRLDRPCLVVAPTSLLNNWLQEAERFAPELKVLLLHGQDRKEHFENINQHDLVCTSYPLLARDGEILLRYEYHLVILDEAQFIKNAKTQYAQVACQLKARLRLCMTGTPMENNLGELWSLFNFLVPGYLGDEPRFRFLFRTPIEKAKNEERRQILARRIAPFLLRRRKSEVLQELPPKTEIIQKVELDGAQRDLYESIRLAMHQRVQSEVSDKGLARSHIVILDALLKLRQVCCDPRLLSLEAAREVKESAKMELLLDLLPEMVDEGRRILLFSQFTSMLALIESELSSRQIGFVKLTGDTLDRKTPVEQFQAGEVPLFLISLKAGGFGLNLTAADTVIHYDPWWNPAVEDQASDRAHRIGQDKKVFIYKLVTQGTVEEKIVAMQGRKRALVEGLLNEERRENLQLTAADLEVLFSPLTAIS